MRLPRRPLAFSQSRAIKSIWSNDFASPQGEAILFNIRGRLLKVPLHDLDRFMRLPRRPLAFWQSLAPKPNLSNDFASP